MFNNKMAVFGKKHRLKLVENNIQFATVVFQCITNCILWDLVLSENPFDSLTAAVTSYINTSILYMQYK